MYYYITETPKSKNEQRVYDQTRAILTQLGIAGEFVTTSMSRPVEEVAELGVAKRYSTIVALGSEELINKVAVLLAGTPYVFGAIPTSDPQVLRHTTGVESIEEAAEALKLRRIRTTAIARIEPNKFFLTKIRINLNRATSLALNLDSARIETEASDVVITGKGKVFTNNRFSTNQPLTRAWNWLVGKPGPQFQNSQFTIKKMTIETNDILPVYLGETIFAKTPLAINVIPKCLKIISKRDRITDKSALAIDHKHYQGRQLYSRTS